jgi:flagellar basal body-associated protein FliL
MKVEPQFPPEPEPLKKDRGCAFSIVILIFLVVLAAAGAWILLWSGGMRDAQKQMQNQNSPAPTEQRP